MAGVNGIGAGMVPVLSGRGLPGLNAPVSRAPAPLADAAEERNRRTPSPAPASAEAIPADRPETRRYVAAVLDESRARATPRSTEENLPLREQKALRSYQDTAGAEERDRLSSLLGVDVYA